MATLAGPFRVVSQVTPLARADSVNEASVGCPLRGQNTVATSWLTSGWEHSRFSHSFQKSKRRGSSNATKGPCRASAGLAGGGREGESEGKAIEAARQQLASMMRPPKLTGKELRDLVFAKYGRSYDVRLCKFNQKVYLQIMWRFLEQRSFPLTEEQYQAQLDAVAEIVSEWGTANMLRDAIAGTKQRPGMTGGGGAKAVSIPLHVARGNGRGKEWMDIF